MKKFILSALFATLITSSAFSAPDPIILKSADLVPVSVTIDYKSSGEFPTAHGFVKIKNVGNAPVKYVGPDSCDPNPFGGAPTCHPRTLYKIGNIQVNNDKSNIIIAPNEVKDIEFYSLDLGQNLPKHCEIVSLSIDTARKFKQYLPIVTSNPYANDTKKVLIRHAWNNKVCFTPINHLTGLPNL